MTENHTLTEQFVKLLRRLRAVGPGQPPFEEVGISSAQLALLEWVATAPGCTLQDIADGLALTPPTVSVGMRKLEETGLLARQPHPADGRAWQFTLTVAGSALWGQVQHYRREKAQRLLAGLTPEEQQILLALLERALNTAEQGAMSYSSNEG
ncbi:MAG: Multidrug resistance operon repressor [Chloroflexi bacterium ADurb.Bin222]|nr:MAG: Multidrug resistance operon repressor [Chloroflexi bacterium ADurb.Bin222]